MSQLGSPVGTHLMSRFTDRKLTIGSPVGSHITAHLSPSGDPYGLAIWEYSRICLSRLRLSRQFNGSFFTVHEIIAYNKVTRIWIYFIVVFGFGFNYLDLDRIRIFIKVNPLLSEAHMGWIVKKKGTNSLCGLQGINTLPQSGWAMD